MRRFICILAIFSLAVNASARSVYNLNAGWTFFTEEATHTDGAAVVNLPHTWNATATKGYFRGEGNYLKSIDIPSDWNGKRVFLRAHGAASVADVFVGGRHISTHLGGSSAFTVELTDYLTFGQSNSLRIIVSNAPRLDILPTAGEENVYGGLFRDVELIVCEPISVSPSVNGGDGIFVSTTRLDSVLVEGTVRLTLLDTPKDAPKDTPKNARVRLRILDSGGHVAFDATVAANTTEIPFSISSPHLWQGTADPHLYNIEVTLSKGDDDAVTDYISIQYGFRTVAIDPANNLTLNGQPIKIHGVIVHRDRAMVGTALTPFQIEEDIALIQELGANAVRVFGGQHAPYFYELCDRAGLLVWNDLPFLGATYPIDIDFIDTEIFKANGKQQLIEMISQLRNHPCIVAWGLFSGVSGRWGDPVPWIRELNDLAHQLDSQRLTAGSSNQDGEINFITDLISFELSFGWRSGMPDGVTLWLEQLRSGWSHLRAGISYGAGGSIFHQSERLERPDPDGFSHPENWQTFVHSEYLRLAVDAPGLWGVFVGNMFDFGAARSPVSPIDDRGLVTFDRKYRKGAFYLYKEAWAK